MYSTPRRDASLVNGIGGSSAAEACTPGRVATSSHHAGSAGRESEARTRREARSPAAEVESQGASCADLVASAIEPASTAPGQSRPIGGVVIHGLALGAMLAAMAAPLAASGGGVEDGKPVPPRGEEVADESPAATPPRSPGAEEIAAIDRLLASDAWPRRAIAVLRLEAFPDALALPRLQAAMADRSPQVRCFSLLGLARLGRGDLSIDLSSEGDPRVVRTALRARVPLDPERVRRGAAKLLGSSRNSDRLLGVEIALASGDQAIARSAEETFLSIVMRMSRTEAGVLSPRLAAISGGEDLRRDYLWRHWARRHRGSLGLHGAWIPQDPADAAASNPIAQLEARSFLGLVEYLQELATRRVDLAIALDCTASMSRALAEAQGGVEDLMSFLGDAVAGLRVGIVAYRDRQDAFETLVHDFTDSIELARRRLWSLEADGGGDGPEAVHPALRDLYGRLSWRVPQDPSRPPAPPLQVAILIGDAPPHPGWGGPSEQLARRAAAAGVTTHVISTAPPHEEPATAAAGRFRGGPPRHFPEIAAAGGGRLVELGDRDSLVAEIAGLTLGDRFEEELRGLFRMYLSVWR